MPMPAFSRFDLYAAPERLLACVLLWHLSFWVLMPMLGYSMLPLDTLELLGWGQEWQWGYYKHPPLGAWLGEIALQLAGGQLEGLYLLAQLCLVITLIYVWRTARLFLDPQRAVLATVLLEGSYFHTYLTPNFNMNALQLPLWAGLGFHFIQAMRGRHAHWYAWGAFAALALLSKYSGLLLLATCAGVLLGTAAGRRALRQPQFWLASLLALALLSPHLAWLAQHGELPLAYLRSFAGDAMPPWQAHVVEPLRFAAGALLGLLFGGMLFLTVRDRTQPTPHPSHDALLVLALCFGPLLLAMLYGIVTGSRLKSTWTFPFFNLAGVALFLLFPTRVDARRWRRFGFALVAVIALTSGAHLLYKTRSDRSKTAFDGRALATAIAQDWQSETDHPLRIVIADHILASIVSGYTPSRPRMLINADFAISLWLDDAALDAHGAVVVCRAEVICFPTLARRDARVRTLEIDGQGFQYWFLPPADRSSGSRPDRL